MILITSSDHKTKSSLSGVCTTWGKSSLLPRSTLISQDCAAWRRLFLVFLGAGGFSLSLMNCMDGFGLVLFWRFFCFSRSKMSAIAQRTLSWRHLYLRAVLHPASMCAIVPLPLHSLHNGSSLITHLWRFVGTPSGAGKRCKRARVSRSQSTWSSISACPTLSNSLWSKFNCPRPAPFFLQVSDLGLAHIPPLPWVCFSPLEDPSHCLPTHGFLMMSFSFSVLSACATDVSAAHLCHDLVVTPAFLTFSSVFVHHHGPALSHLELFNH